ncbi:hypothetical protein OFC21_33570, partial [Escherichia coli]|nr:hypothetical protein [Escherichia coli]
KSRYQYFKVLIIAFTVGLHPEVFDAQIKHRVMLMASTKGQINQTQMQRATNNMRAMLATKPDQYR